jgi:tRNA pseudouridine38-40 synthase
MARYQLTLAYDGTDFFGSQRQAKRRTVQGELESALRRLGWAGRSIILSGRTDTGVHATGQVAACDLDWAHTDEELARALNSSLSKDMAVRKVKLADANFHPRFDALSRMYRYRLFFHPLRDPIRERFAWRVHPEASADLLNKAASVFLGLHDFSAFGSLTTPKGTTARTVTKSEWAQTAEDEWQYEVSADAFLYRMVRRLVFVQVAAAQRKVEVKEIVEALNQAKTAKRSALPSGLAPANGLTLVEVEYRESIP